MDSIVVYLFLTFSLLLVDIHHLTELSVSNTSARKIKHFIFCCTANMYNRFWDAAKNDFINIQPRKRGPPLEFINQRGSASRFINQKEIPSTK